MHAHPVRYLLPNVPFAMAAPAYARCSPPFPFIVLCAPVGGKCAPDAHWRRVRLWPPMRPRLCVGPAPGFCFSVRHGASARPGLLASPGHGSPRPCEFPATKSGLGNPPIKSICVGLSCGADQCRFNWPKKQDNRRLGKKVSGLAWWLVFENFPEGIVISECARIRILKLRV